MSNPQDIFHPAEGINPSPKTPSPSISENDNDIDENTIRGGAMEKLGDLRKSKVDLNEQNPISENYEVDIFLLQRAVLTDISLKSKI